MWLQECLLFVEQVCDVTLILQGLFTSPVMSEAGFPFLHPPHSLSVQKPGYKIRSFLLAWTQNRLPFYLPIVTFHPPFLCVFQYLDTKSESPVRFLFQKPGYKIWSLSLSYFSSPTSFVLFVLIICADAP